MISMHIKENYKHKKALNIYNMVNGVNIGYEENPRYIVNKNSQEEGHIKIYWKEAVLENKFTIIKENSICKCWSSINGRKDILNHTKYR